MSNIIFLVFWIAVNIIGFISGSYLGATDGGLITNAAGRISGLILGDLVFGAMIGLSQWLAFRFTRFMEISPWWIVLTSLGFLFGARTGSLLTYRILDLHGWLEPSFVFGIFMGGSIGFATHFEFVNPFKQWKHLLWWTAVSTLAWVLGEGIAFASHFSQATVPYVALAISSVTGLGLIGVRHIASEWEKSAHSKSSHP